MRRTELSGEQLSGRHSDRSGKYQLPPKQTINNDSGIRGFWG